jgi:putative RecB family exonuclease
MHACVEQFFRVKTPPCPTLEQLYAIYEREWLSEGYGSAEEETRYKAYGKDILKKFWDIHAPGFRLPIALEHRFFLDVQGIKLMGFIDRVDKLESGKLAIVDYKTNQELFTGDYVDNNLQLTLYQMAAEQTWRLPVESMTLYHLRTNTPCVTLPRGKDKIDDVKRLVVDVAGKIERGIFPATEHEFCPCDFPHFCPYYKHKFPIPQTDSNGQALLPGLSGTDAAAEAVNRYAALQAQIKGLEAELAAVKDKIITYCQQRDVKRVFGEESQITYRMIEKTGYDEAETKQVLEPLGLWSKVLSFDQTLLKRLITEGALTPDLKKKIENLKHITSSYPQLYLKKGGAEEEE